MHTVAKHSAPRLTPPACLLARGCMQTCRCRSLPHAHCSLPHAHCCTPTAHCRTLTVARPLLTAARQLPHARCSLPHARCSLPHANCRTRAAHCRTLTAARPLLTAAPVRPLQPAATRHHPTCALLQLVMPRVECSALSSACRQQTRPRLRPPCILFQAASSFPSSAC
eukprot:314701-Chlamydomonas_euryale.AAC.1